MKYTFIYNPAHVFTSEIVGEDTVNAMNDIQANLQPSRWPKAKYSTSFVLTA